MKMAQDIVLRPIITEHSMGMLGERKYSFKVANDATKVEIAKACETLFGVKVQKVNTLHVRGRSKRMNTVSGRPTSGKTPDWKKAIVTLTQDSKGIEFFESMM